MTQRYNELLPSKTRKTWRDIPVQITRKGDEDE